MNTFSPRITLGILNHNNQIYEKYIKNSLISLPYNYELIIKQDLMPAMAYNQIIKEAKHQYILFLHIDVHFDNYFLNSVAESIKLFPNFGAMGVVGVVKAFLKKKQYIRASETSNKYVTTLDSCCILINKKHNLKFDDIHFNEYHHFIEDYCMQVKYNLKLQVNLINTNFFCDTLNQFKNINNYFYHSSNTIKSQGARWGNWLQYKIALDKKWGKKVITT